MGPAGNILVNSPISTFQQGLTHSALDQNSLKLAVSLSFGGVIFSDMLDISGLTVHIRSGLGWNNIIHEL